MRLHGVGVRAGRAAGSVTLEPPLGPGSSDPRRIAAFGPIDPIDPRIGPDAGWVGVLVASDWRLSTPGLADGPPLVAGVDLDILREGDPAELDGSSGAVDLPTVKEVEVVTSFLERPDGRVLLMRRSDRVGSFQGRWAGVSGFLEDPTPEAQARREIHEETGVDPALPRLAASGRPVYARDASTIFTVHPFRFRVPDIAVTIDWEHTAFDWVEPAEIVRRPTVPKLDRVWRAVAPGRP